MVLMLWGWGCIRNRWWAEGSHEGSSKTLTKAFPVNNEIGRWFIMFGYNKVQPTNFIKGRWSDEIMSKNFTSLLGNNFMELAILITYLKNLIIDLHFQVSKKTMPFYINLKPVKILYVYVSLKKSLLLHYIY